MLKVSPEHQNQLDGWKEHEPEQVQPYWQGDMKRGGEAASSVHMHSLSLHYPIMFCSCDDKILTDSPRI